jgi:hypothetical protein
MGLGVTGGSFSSTTPLLNPQYHARAFPPFPGPTLGTFLSIAFLRTLKRVDLCRVSNRCIGILIHYVNGQSAVLGQWRTGGMACHSCIYNSDSISPTHIYFRVTTFGHHKIVTDISFSDDKSKIVPGTEYHITELQQVKLLFNLVVFIC